MSEQETNKKNPYSQVPIKQVGPNKRGGWLFYLDFLNKQALIEWRKSLKIKKKMPNKRVGWKIC